MNSLITGFIAIGIVLIGCAVAAIATPLLRRREEHGGAPVAAIITAVALPAGAVLFYLSISNHDWQPTTTRGEAVPTTASSLQELVGGLEQRMAESPDDAAGWLLLGSTYMQLQRLPDARRAFATALSLEPTAEAKLSLAEVDIVQDRANLTGEAGRLVEEALAAEPENPKALFYGGMVAMARGDNETVGVRWRKLLAMAPPDDIRQLLEQQLAQIGESTETAETMVASPAPATAAPTAPQGVPAAAGQFPGDSEFAINVSIADDLAPRIKANSALFVLARRPGVPGPPLAAIRTTAEQLPASLRISDANVMMAGQSLSGVDPLELVARVSNGGGPVAVSGDLFGQVTWSSATDADRTIRIVIDQIVE